MKHVFRFVFLEYGFSFLSRRSDEEWKDWEEARLPVQFGFFSRSCLEFLSSQFSHGYHLNLFTRFSSWSISKIWSSHYSVRKSAERLWKSRVSSGKVLFCFLFRFKWIRKSKTRTQFSPQLVTRQQRHHTTGTSNPQHSVISVMSTATQPWTTSTHQRRQHIFTSIQRLNTSTQRLNTSTQVRNNIDREVISNTSNQHINTQGINQRTDQQFSQRINHHTTRHRLDMRHNPQSTHHEHTPLLACRHSGAIV